jgi:hypothetical protein
MSCPNSATMKLGPLCSATVHGKVSPLGAPAAVSTAVRSRPCRAASRRDGVAHGMVVATCKPGPWSQEGEHLYVQMIEFVIIPLLDPC